MQDQIYENLKHYFGFNEFKNGQREVVENLLGGESSMAIFPTGAGKSLCYQLTALLLPHVTIVVSPLLSLMKDQLDFLIKNNIPAARLDSTLSRSEYNIILERAKSGQLKILMISVERFKNERFRYHLEQMKISMLAVDEAHCISEWGHNFRPEYLKLPDYRKEFNIPMVLLLTATATTDVIRDVGAKFCINEKNVTITGFYRENLFLQVTPSFESEKKSKLLNRIKQNIENPTIVYVTLQKTADDISDFLISNGVRAVAYHAGMKYDKREQIQNSFISGNINCIVATIAFGMGIDKKDIRTIIHYDLPKTIENYSQEIGRSGRDGEKSFCEVLANGDNVNILENFVYGDTPEKETINKLLQIIKDNDSNKLEVKAVSLSRELDIRILPFKTLLVYLDIYGILKPKFTYFSDYSFKFRSSQDQIINVFQGERKTFVSTLFNCCETKKTWTHLNMDLLLSMYSNDRKRVIVALDYFDEKGWIELQAKQAVDVYEIINREFDLNDVTEKIYRLFTNKEKREIERIHNMIGFFESESCISRKLAGYFGENIQNELCGHCSFCKEGKAAFCSKAELEPVEKYDAVSIVKNVRAKLGIDLENNRMAKLLCGIHTPYFYKYKVKKLDEHGLLEKHPFQEVKNWISKFV